MEGSAGTSHPQSPTPRRRNGYHAPRTPTRPPALGLTSDRRAVGRPGRGGGDDEDEDDDDDIDEDESEGQGQGRDEILSRGAPSPPDSDINPFADEEEGFEYEHEQETNHRHQARIDDGNERTDSSDEIIGSIPCDDEKWSEPYYIYGAHQDEVEEVLGEAAEEDTVGQDIHPDGRDGAMNDEDDDDLWDENGGYLGNPEDLERERAKLSNENDDGEEGDSPWAIVDEPATPDQLHEDFIDPWFRSEFPAPHIELPSEGRPGWSIVVLCIFIY